MIKRVFAAVLLVFLLSNAAVMAQSGNQTGTPVVIVDINSAPLEEIEGVVLDNLLATKIIEGRPYANKRQLLSRQLVSEEQYERIKDRVVARRIVPR